MSYHVHLEQFEGPLELLLHLIEKEELDVTRVSLSRVADQYLEYLSETDTIALSNLAQFLSIATRLILLKSRALLPLLQFTEEEEESIEDLERQLREYQRFRTAAKELGILLLQGRHSFPRTGSLGMTISFSPPPKLKIEDLTRAFTSVLGEIPIVEKLEEETLATVVTLEDKMFELRQSLATRIQTSFREVTAGIESRVEIIVAFLALLELVKQRAVQVRQRNFIGDIHIEAVSQK